ncbi:putative beta-lactamase [Streptomyces azureus]|uniref:Putative beta-lactamase n=1 Tax=Streptomyces azureus TaxID=146537 RepID=A0A0K8PI14_STRAJ|nr:putative beta-lactamase [Streptomyces azureus]
MIAHHIALITIQAGGHFLREFCRSQPSGVNHTTVPAVPAPSRLEAVPRPLARKASDQPCHHAENAQDSDAQGECRDDYP